MAGRDVQRQLLGRRHLAPELGQAQVVPDMRMRDEQRVEGLATRPLGAAQLVQPRDLRLDRRRRFDQEQAAALSVVHAKTGGEELAPALPGFETARLAATQVRHASVLSDAEDEELEATGLLGLGMICGHEDRGARGLTRQRVQA
jgi:hypothetical protein